jgi:hypothetical protein
MRGTTRFAHKETAMNKTLTIATFAAIGLAISATAHAGGTLLGASVQILPGGSIAGDADGNLGPVGGSTDFDGDLDTGFGVVLNADYVIQPHLTVGLAPRYVFNVKNDSGNFDASQLDIPVRVTGRFLVARKIAVLPYGQVGYSFLFPEDWNENFDKPSGFLAGLGVGGAFALSPKLALVGDLGYDWGFQHTSGSGTVVGVPYDYDITTGTRQFHIGIGVQTAL